MTTTTQAGTGLKEVDAAELRESLDAGQAVVVDVREPDEHQREHIPGSVLVSLSSFAPEDVPRHDERRVVLHCGSGVRSAEAARTLLDAGWPEVLHLRGGIKAWKAAGLDTVRRKGAPIPVMRQVQLAVGLGVLAFTILGATVSPWFLIGSAFFGAGLAFAGATGSCGMASLLRLMPWNRAGA